MDESTIIFDDSNSWFEDSKRLNMIWRLVNDLDQPKFWSYGHLKDPKMENEASKNILLSSLRPWTKIARRHEQVVCGQKSPKPKLVGTCPLETFQDFLIKLDIEPLMHPLKISIFSLNSDIIRLTKIMINLVKDCKIRTFKVIFQCLKLVESFRKKNSVKNIWLGDQLLLMKFFENFDF